MMSLQFTHDGRQLVVQMQPTVGAFRFAVWEGGRNVSQNDTIIYQDAALYADSHGQMERLFNATMQRVRDEVISGRVALRP